MSKKCNFCKQVLPPGFKAEFGRPYQFDPEEIKQLRQKGKSIKEIMQAVGCSRRTVTRVLSLMCK